MKNGRRKPEKIKQEKSLKLFYLLGDSSDRFSKLTTFLCWSRRGPRHSQSGGPSY